MPAPKVGHLSPVPPIFKILYISTVLIQTLSCWRKDDCKSIAEAIQIINTTEKDCRAKTRIVQQSKLASISFSLQFDTMELKISNKHRITGVIEFLETKLYSSIYLVWRIDHNVVNFSIERSFTIKQFFFSLRRVRYIANSRYKVIVRVQIEILLYGKLRIMKYSGNFPSWNGELLKGESYFISKVTLYREHVISRYECSEVRLYF